MKYPKCNKKIYKRGRERERVGLPKYIMFAIYTQYTVRKKTTPRCGIMFSLKYQQFDFASWNKRHLWLLHHLFVGGGFIQVS